MTPHKSVRPHLLDEKNIQNIIFESGLSACPRDQIVAYLVENYAVDLDLLASVLATLQILNIQDTRFRHAA